MALRNIITGDDPILRKTSREVTKFDDRLHQLLDDMKETMDSVNGVGLAAVQVGALRRAIIINVDDENGHIELINPVVTERSEEIQCGQEGCLSFPGETRIVPRPMQATVEAFDRYGEPFTLTGEGLLARAICHETDHLEGQLFYDLAIEDPEEYGCDEIDEYVYVD